MIESIISMELPAGGHLAIRRNRICPEQETKQCRRISLVSGIHGDELEGQYICYETARRVKEHPEYLKGIVDIYPALNPLGIDMASRTVPRLEMDMNRMFPGDALDDRFVEACQMHCYIEYMADVLTVGDLEERVALVDKLMQDGKIAFLQEYITRKKKEVAHHGEEPENA